MLVLSKLGLPLPSLPHDAAAKMEGDGGGPSPGVFMLQQNTRLGEEGGVDCKCRSETNNL